MAKAKEIKSNYGDDAITVLKGLEAVRKRPGMYIGSTDSRGLHHLIWEIADNAIDEVLAGYADHLKITIHKGNIIEVEDNGRGIPIGMNKEEKRPTPEVVYCVLHAGGKFSADGAYKVSGGLHGVGSSVVNALSEWLELEIIRDGKCYTQRFENGGSKINKHKIVSTSEKKTGTKVRFKPDPSIFSTTIIDYKTCATRFKESAFLLRGLKIELVDERSNNKEVFCYKDGIVEYVKDLNKDNEVVSNPIYFEGSSMGIQVEAAMQFGNKVYNENLLSFVNNIRTRDGGTHETGFRTALTKAFNEFARNKGLLKPKDPNLEGIDIREGLTAIVSVRIGEDKLQFEGQTKNKLGSPDAKAAVESVIYEKLSYYLAENGELATTLVNKSINAYKAREAARNARDQVREIRKHTQKVVNLVGKLAPPQGKDSKLNELFIVEGDSAGGSAKQGRNRRFQAILPLRGKVLNAEKTKLEDLLRNEEINSLIHAIGGGFGPDFNVGRSNYNKVIIMTDADDDGSHIQILLLTFFFRYMYKLIEAGKVYIALPPLYKITYKNQIKYAWTDEELEEMTNKMRNYTLQRFKGLGEMNAEQLWETTMNPESRTLIQVKVEDFSEAEQRIQVLMGDNVEPRREWIEQNVVFENIDNFTLEGDEDE